MTISSSRLRVLRWRRAWNPSFITSKYSLPRYWWCLTETDTPQPSHLDLQWGIFSAPRRNVQCHRGAEGRDGSLPGFVSYKDHLSAYFPYDIFHAATALIALTDVAFALLVLPISQVLTLWWDVCHPLFLWWNSIAHCVIQMWVFLAQVLLETDDCLYSICLRMLWQLLGLWYDYSSQIFPLLVDLSSFIRRIWCLGAIPFLYHVWRWLKLSCVCHIT